MRYSKDLRQRVIKFVKNGGSKAEAARHFHITRRTVYNWLERPEAKKCGPKQSRKIDMPALQQHIQNHPDAYLIERAELFDVTPSGLWRAMKRLGITKKNVGVQTK